MILPGTGRGTVEDGGGARAAALPFSLMEQPSVPLHHAAHGPPPLAGED